MSILSTHIDDSFLNASGFIKGHWGAPHNWSDDNVMWDGIITIRRKYDEVDWECYYFPPGFKGYVTSAREMNIDPAGRILATKRYGNNSIFSDVLNDPGDWILFVELLKKKSK